jgi:hypothetical protein
VKKDPKIKSFYVIRFDDGTYHSGTTSFYRKRVVFRKARVYTMRNHAALSIKELRMKDASIVELSVKEPCYETAPEKESDRALP